MRRFLHWVVVAAVIVLVAVIAFWAGRVALVPPEDPLASSTQPVTYEVVEQTIGRSLRFAAVAEWEVGPLARSWAPGIVTSVDFEPGATVDAGDVLFTVDLRPVVLAEGPIPAFRNMQSGDEGADVSQLQAMLAALGFLDAEPDGQFGTETEAAVRAWKATLGVDADGVVRHGDIVFAPELPARVVPTEALTVGAMLAGGEMVVDRLAPDPTVIVPLTPEQRDLVPLSGEVVVTHRNGTWRGVIARAAEPLGGGGGGVLDLVLETEDGGPICREECIGAIPPLGRTDFGVEIVVVPETTGPVVPLAAIVTDPGGGHTVRLENGTDVAVDVVVSTGGLAVVSGLEGGDIVVLPFTEPGGP